MQPPQFYFQPRLNSEFIHTCMHSIQGPPLYTEWDVQPPWTSRPRGPPWVSVALVLWPLRLFRFVGRVGPLGVRVGLVGAAAGRWGRSGWPGVWVGRAGARSCRSVVWAVGSVTFRPWPGPDSLFALSLCPRLPWPLPLFLVPVPCLRPIGWGRRVHIYTNLVRV